MDNLCIDGLAVFGLPRVAFVELAADLGCRYITTGLQSTPYNPHGYPEFSLRDDRAMRRDLLAVMRDRGVSIGAGDGVLIWPDGVQHDSWASDLEIMAELGITRINTLSLDPDLSRTFDKLGALVETAAVVGIETMLEFAPCFVIADLPTALAAVKHVGRPEIRLTIDTMHVARSGAGAADIAALDPHMIGYVQLCDVPLKPKIPDYMEEAMYQRMAPGEGELPLYDLLAVLPRDRVISLEIPLRSEAEAGVGPNARLSRCVKGARKLLDRLDSEGPGSPI